MMIHMRSVVNVTPSFSENCRALPVAGKSASSDSAIFKLPPKGRPLVFDNLTFHLLQPVTGKCRISAFIQFDHGQWAW